MKSFFFVTFSVLFWCTNTFAGLDDSGEKKITVRSEISRGYDAVWNASLKHFSLSILETCVSMNQPVDANKQAGTDSDGFMLGARYGEWIEIVERLKTADGRYNGADELDTCRRGAERDYKEFRRLQEALQIDDAAFFEAIGFKTPAKAISELSAWEDKQKAFYEAQKSAHEKWEAGVRAEKEKQVADAARARTEWIRAHLPQLVKQSQVRALNKHPDLATAGSALNTKFVAAYRKLQTDKSPRLDEPNWPEKLADECGAGATVVANR